MIEDDDYRASTQYRYWSYTKAQLNDTRRRTNTIAADKVKLAFRRSRSAQNQSQDVNSMRVPSDDVDIQTLSADEEFKIVEWGSAKIVEMGEAMEPRVPSHIVATAIQYLRRFYLTNSPMTYHPKQITACALFLATKADHFYIPLHKFVKSFGGKESDVKAPEFLLMQGLRFTLDVRHPMRGLEGGVVEIKALADNGQLGVLERHVADKKQSAALRIGIAADKAKTMLTTAAQMTDAYFLYTPAQIWLASMFASDQELVLRYLDQVLDRLGDVGLSMKSKLVSTISECADLLAAYVSPNDNPARAKEIRKVGKKLNACQNPEKLDMVDVARAKAAEKREGNESDAEKALKKRKLERERLEKDGEVFGPSLKHAG